MTYEQQTQEEIDTAHELNTFQQLKNMSMGLLIFVSVIGMLFLLVYLTNAFEIREIGAVFPAVVALGVALVNIGVLALTLVALYARHCALCETELTKQHNARVLEQACLVNND